MKPDATLGRYVVGGEFIESLQSTDGIGRSKVVDVIVEILTGRVHDMAGPETHQPRQSSAGSSPFVRRADGATCWRVALQINAPQARRLHHWQLTDAMVELSSVRRHDDLRV